MNNSITTTTTTTTTSTTISIASNNNNNNSQQEEEAVRGRRGAGRGEKQREGENVDTRGTAAPQCRHLEEGRNIAALRGTRWEDKQKYHDFSPVQGDDSTAAGGGGGGGGGGRGGGRGDKEEGKGRTRIREAPRGPGGKVLRRRLSSSSLPPLPPPPPLTLPKFTVDVALSAFRTASIAPPFHSLLLQQAKNSGPERMQPLRN
ncbi:hypothetical protein E2C01_016704 [Portunus trituberculatus]|uniref:Uncharacterized protein n=1 Tax=Portunus trituberculatus TaxID=210409 RepID=A0A5B7DQY1_PORTR|nr:hypothetical protein [Portunus trituberculatus]